MRGVSAEKLQPARLPATHPRESESIELRLLLDAVFLKYGYDFRDYAKPLVERRVRRCLDRSGLESISALQHAVLYDRDHFDALLRELSITVTEMFRDPSFFGALRRQVLPVFAERPQLRIWHAGCATGEEIYSMTILLHEAGLLERSLIYATDINEVALQKAREGVIPLEQMRTNTANYHQAGGTSCFTDYYHARYDSARLDPSLLEHVVFANHNLATDASFGEMDLIVCRNVLIYFNRELQDRALGLFVGSLVPDGLLCIGSRESVRFSSCESAFVEHVPGERIYRRAQEVPT